jgi:Na+/phosphate symporter
MTTLRSLVFYAFFAGVFFDSFITSLARNHFGNAAIFILFTLFELWVVLKYYDRAKVGK